MRIAIEARILRRARVRLDDRTIVIAKPTHLERRREVALELPGSTALAVLQWDPRGTVIDLFVDGHSVVDGAVITQSLSPAVAPHGLYERLFGRGVAGWGAIVGGLLGTFVVGAATASSGGKGGAAVPALALGIGCVGLWVALVKLVHGLLMRHAEWPDAYRVLGLAAAVLIPPALVAATVVAL